jgi:hypothetical protein
MNNINNFLNDLSITMKKSEENKSLFSLSTYIDRNPNINIPNVCIVK